jgi:hypothetical protein
MGLAAIAGLVGLAGVAQAQINLNVVVRRASDDLTTINVQPGEQVNYEIEGILSPSTGHMGLALVGFNLNYNGGSLPPCNTPVAPDLMANFVKPNGITNPDGYGGTIGATGELLQVGGGQNTIKNTPEFADFPIGNVQTGIAQNTPVILATGSLTAPQQGGPYTLVLSQLFANVIEQGQTGNEDFWVTKAAQAGTIQNLTINVITACAASTFASSSPVSVAHGGAYVNGNSLWRQSRNTIRMTFNVAGNGCPALALPGPGELLIQELQAGGAFGTNLNTGSNFTFTIEGGNVLRVRESNTPVLQDGKWYAIRNTGAWANVAAFEAQYAVQLGDQNGNGFTQNNDVLTINAAPNAAQPDDSRLDVDGNGFKNNADVLLANASQPSALPAKPGGH